MNMDNMLRSLGIIQNLFKRIPLGEKTIMKKICNSNLL